MTQPNPLKGLIPPRPKVEREATESTALDAEFAAKLAAQGATAPAPSDLQLMAGDQIRRQHRAEQTAHFEERFSGPGVDRNLPARAADLQARAAEADRAQAERDRQAVDEALGRS